MLPPGAGELTQAELLQVELTYPDAVAPGRPFAVAAQWEYQRVTDANTYGTAASDLTQNVHLASSYEIDAPDVVATHVKDGEWIIRARFSDQDGKLFRGSQLLVQCFLTGPQGQLLRLLLQDDGNVPDAKPGDGIYGGWHFFSQSALGLWHYFVIAQDVNHATPDMAPEEAAQIIGGMLLTHQLTITFDQDNCPLVPDGYVNVV